jgi:outer membrane protein X
MPIMKLAAIVLSSLLAGSALAQESAHGILIGPRAGVELRDSHLAIGGEARFGIVSITQGIRLDLRAVFNYYLISDLSVWDLAGEALFAFDVRNDVVEPYALAGLNIGHAELCAGAFCASDNKVGLNLGGGAKFLVRSRVQPFAELRFTVGDYEPVLLAGGVLFVIQ